MSILYVYHVSSADQPSKVLTHAEDITSTLAEHAVEFGRWHAETPVLPGASPQEVAGVYAAQIESIMAQRGHRHCQVSSVDSAHPQRAELRAGLLEEHQRNGSELRLFVAGRGMQALHIADFVYLVLCEKNDLIVIPPGMRQWFDMGESPHLVSISLCDDPQGWELQLTGEDIASQYARLDDL